MGLGLSLGKYLGLSSGGALLGPNGSPTSCTLTVISDTELQVDWTNGATNQDGTYVLYKLHSATEWSTLTASGALTTKNITGLIAASNYDVKTAHFKGSKLSDYSNTANSYTFPDLTKFLYLGYYENISGGQMPNELGVDYLTVDGVAGSETYTCPDNATYKVADEDYIWANTGDVIRNVTTEELIGYDFDRTLVWYGDTSPNAIVAIAILKSGETLTETESNIMRTVFHLSIWWDGTLSEYGNLKSNRGAVRSVWLGWLETEALNLINRMISLDEEPVKARKIIINRTVKKLKDAGYWSRMDRLCTYAAHAENSSKLNWIKDDYNSTYMTHSVWTMDRGLKTSGNTPNNDCIKTDFIPSVDGVNFTLNSCSFGLYYRTNTRKTSVGYEGAVHTNGTDKVIIARPTKTDTETYACAMNAATKTATLAEDLNGLLIGTRTSSTTINLYFNGTVKISSTASTSGSLVDRELYEGGLNTGLGYPVNLDDDEKALSFIMDGVSAADEAGLRAILVDDYLYNIGAKV